MKNIDIKKPIIFIGVCTLLSGLLTILWSNIPNCFVTFEICSILIFYIFQFIFKTNRNRVDIAATIVFVPSGIFLLVSSFMKTFDRLSICMVGIDVCIFSVYFFSTRQATITFRKKENKSKE